MVVATAASATAKIEALATHIFTDDADRKAAAEVRDKVAAGFAKEGEGDLFNTTFLQDRAIAVIEREAS